MSGAISGHFNILWLKLEVNYLWKCKIMIAGKLIDLRSHISLTFLFGIFHIQGAEERHVFRLKVWNKGLGVFEAIIKVYLLVHVFLQECAEEV